MAGAGGGAGVGGGGAGVGVSGGAVGTAAVAGTAGAALGTSDGRFIAPLGAEVVELGPVNASIHKIDESVAIDELERLPRLYLSIAERLLGIR